MTRNLMLLYWNMGKTQFRTAPDNTKVAFVFITIGALFITVLFSFAIGGMAVSLPLHFFEPIIPYVFSALLAFTILFGVPQVFKNLYGTNDLAFLFTLPIKTKSIYWVKFLQSFLGVPGILWVVSIVLIMVFGMASQASLIFYPVAIIVSLLIMLLGLSVAYLINLMLIQIIPVHRAKELMTAMSAIAGIIVYILFQLPNLLHQNNRDNQMVTELPQMPKWLPMEWGGRSLMEAHSGSSGFILPFILLLLFTGLLIFLSSLLVEKGFRTGWIKMNDGSRSKKKRKRKKVNVQLNHPIIAIGIKEWRAIQRDMREWVTFLPFLIFMIFPFITIFNNDGSKEFIFSNPAISWIVLQGIFLFMFTFMTSGFSSSAIAREAYSIHLLRIMPLTGWQIALGKFWINWLIPVVILSVLEVVGGLIFQWKLFDIFLGIIVVSIMSLGITGIGLWIGSIGAKYNPNNPQNRLETGVSFLLMILSFLYLFIAAFPSLLVLIPTDTLNLFQDGEKPIGIVGMLFTMLKWKAANMAILTVISGLITLLISVGVAIFTLYLTVIRINKGLTINFVTNKK
ncbi:ABC-2 type transport system permease protein [Cytobacillus eiseniae]|uniref:ABC-2 type transport system permease protein n=1 Tax=Cytobacillus eiseniae TaxID=762947 RepID=A0ABS4RA48_9BACI|nr:hypothetical protein [Cytobacillus eiseniae]MBP2239776.1 ABC-2 type transport system permease protein [Cytobacillus eiseniae]